MMRTNIVIEDQLMHDAMQACGARTKREAVELGLRTLLEARTATADQGLSRTSELAGRPGSSAF
jgi:Arc/MetJ family transcription regulator